MEKATELKFLRYFPRDPHARLADPNSPDFDPLEYKRRVGVLPKVAKEAARKLKLIED